MMTGRNSRWKSNGRRLAGVLAAATILAFGIQGVSWAQMAKVTPDDKNQKKEEKAQKREAKKQNQKQSSKGKKQASRGAAAAQIFVDPDQGQVHRLTAEEAQKLAAGLGKIVTQSAEGLQVVQLPDGTLMVDLQDTFNEVAMATVDGDGKVSFHCVDNAASAEALLANSAAAKPAPKPANKLEEK